MLPDEIAAELEELHQGKISAAEKRKKLRDRIKEVNAENVFVTVCVGSNMILQLKSKNGELKIENEELKNTLAKRGDAVKNSAEEPAVWEFFCLCKIHPL